MIKATKWLEDSPPSESALLNNIQADGYTTSTWSKEAGFVQDPAPAPSDTAFSVSKGMARITLPNSPEEYADLMVGDRLNLPSGTQFGIMAGPAGVTMIQGTK